MRILKSMKNENAYEKWQEVKRNFNKKYYYNNRKR